MARVSRPEGRDIDRNGSGSKAVSRGAHELFIGSRATLRNPHELFIVGQQAHSGGNLILALVLILTL